MPEVLFIWLQLFFNNIGDSLLASISINLFELSCLEKLDLIPLKRKKYGRNPQVCVIFNFHLMICNFLGCVGVFFGFFLYLRDFSLELQYSATSQQFNFINHSSNYNDVCHNITNLYFFNSLCH